jgi:hypothetical protein
LDAECLRRLFRKPGLQNSITIQLHIFDQQFGHGANLQRKLPQGLGDITHWSHLDAMQI